LGIAIKEGLESLGPHVEESAARTGAEIGACIGSGIGAASASTCAGIAVSVALVATRTFFKRVLLPIQQNSTPYLSFTPTVTRLYLILFRGLVCELGNF